MLGGYSRTTTARSRVIAPSSIHRQTVLKSSRHHERGDNFTIQNTGRHIALPDTDLQQTAKETARSAKAEIETLKNAAQNEGAQ